MLVEVKAFRNRTTLLRRGASWVICPRAGIILLVRYGDSRVLDHWTTSSTRSHSFPGFVLGCWRTPRQNEPDVRNLAFSRAHRLKAALFTLQYIYLSLRPEAVGDIGRQSAWCPFSMDCLRGASFDHSEQGPSDLTT